MGRRGGNGRRRPGSIGIGLRRWRGRSGCRGRRRRSGGDLLFRGARLHGGTSRRAYGLGIQQVCYRRRGRGSSGCGRHRSVGRRWCRRRPVPGAGFNFGDGRAHRHRLAFLRDDAQQFAGHRGRHFHRYFVGDHFHQRVVAFYPVAGPFQPLADGAFNDALADLRQFNELRHGSILIRNVCIDFAGPGFGRPEK